MATVITITAWEKKHWCIVQVYFSTVKTHSSTCRDSLMDPYLKCLHYVFVKIFNWPNGVIIIKSDFVFNFQISISALKMQDRSSSSQAVWSDFLPVQDDVFK